jgi:hypothetical protein
LYSCSADGVAAAGACFGSTTGPLVSATASPAPAATISIVVSAMIFKARSSA